MKQLPEEFKKEYPEIEWRKIVDLRNILIHQYSGIDQEITWDVARNKATALKTFIEKVLSEGLNPTIHL